MIKTNALTTAEYLADVEKRFNKDRDYAWCDRLLADIENESLKAPEGEKMSKKYEKLWLFLILLGIGLIAFLAGCGACFLFFSLTSALGWL